jgi:hypothetical protein
MTISLVCENSRTRLAQAHAFNHALKIQTPDINYRFSIISSHTVIGCQSRVITSLQTSSEIL